MKIRQNNVGLVGSTGSLPSIVSLRKEVKRLRMVASVLHLDDVMENAQDAEKKLDELVALVDDFYRLLGNRNWVFSDALNLDRMKVVVSKPSPEESEQELIAYLREDDVLHGMINRLRRFPDMRTRLPLLQKAEHDFLDGRYYSSVLVTISMMDGFVNDAFKDERRGLASRSPEEMSVEDCAAAVWNGLPLVQRVFTKSFRKRCDHTVFEVYRHGIVHGMITDYDNVVVASKAWCMLFAVVDWVDARTKEREAKDNESEKLFKTIANSIDMRVKMDEWDKKLDEWRAHFVDIDNPSDPDKEVLDSCVSYLEAWKTNNFGQLGSFFPNFIRKSPRAQAGEARSLYSSHPICRYSIERVERPAAAQALMTVRLYNDASAWTAMIPLSKFNGVNPVPEWESGEWKVVRYGVAPFEEASKEPANS